MLKTLKFLTLFLLFALTISVIVVAQRFDFLEITEFAAAVVAFVVAIVVLVRYGGKRRGESSLGKNGIATIAGGLAHSAYRRRPLRFLAIADGILLAAVAVLGYFAVTGPHLKIKGRVTIDSRPLEGQALIEVVSHVRCRSDDEGEFTIVIPDHGEESLAINACYQGRAGRADVPRGRLLGFELKLDTPIKGVEESPDRLIGARVTLRGGKRAGLEVREGLPFLVRSLESGEVTRYDATFIGADPMTARWSGTRPDGTRFTFTSSGTTSVAADQLSPVVSIDATVEPWRPVMCVSDQYAEDCASVEIGVPGVATSGPGPRPGGIELSRYYGNQVGEICCVACYGTEVCANTVTLECGYCFKLVPKGR